MKYVSIDIETTGLDPIKNQIVEFAAVVDDLQNPDKLLEDLPVYRAVFIHKSMIINSYCCRLHKNLWEEIHQYMTDGVERIGTIYIKEPHALFASSFKDWLIKQGYETKPNGKITFNAAGKNFASFDKLFIENVPAWSYHFNIRHRVLDPGPLFVRPDDDCLPDLNACLERCGIQKTVDHTAIGDALDVVRVIRKHFEI